MDVGGICASPLWNESISWDTKDPYLSECFKHLILVIGPCAVLWLVAPFEFVKIYKYRGTPNPWTRRSIAKIVCKVLLLIICVIELVKEIYAYVTHTRLGSDGLIAAVAYFITIVLTVILTMMCKKRGLRSSVALPSFWMISTITTLITIYDDIHGLDSSSWVSLISLVDDSTVFVISLIQLILSNLSEKGASPYGRQLMDYCPLDGCPLMSRLTFSWLLGLLVDSTKKSLHSDDLISLCSEFRSTRVADRFHEIWNKTYKDNSNPTVQTPTECFSKSELFSQSKEERPAFDQSKEKSLLRALLKLASQYLIISSVFEILYTALYFLPVYIISLILNNDKEPEWHKFVFAFVLFIVLLFGTFIDSQRKYYGLTSAFKIKTAILNVIFEKALLSQQLQNVGKYLQEDAENIFQMVCLLSEVWGASVRILIGLYLLWLFLGSASFVGVGIAALFIPVTILIGNTANYFQEDKLPSSFFNELETISPRLIILRRNVISLEDCNKWGKELGETKSSEVKSEWLKVLSECLHGIRSLKLYAWEEFFLRKLKSLRKLEISKLRKTQFLKMIFKITILSSISLVSLATFYVFVVMTSSFDLKTIFLAFATLYLLKTPFTGLLRLLAHFIQGLASISHVQTFLQTKEVQRLPQLDTNSKRQICLENATFVWTDTETFQLRNMTFNIGDGSLIAIIGESLSGKSSLLRALVGEMEKLEGTASVKGEVALVSDNPWIQNATIEENILFAKPKVDIFYNSVLKTSELLPDIENLPQGDETKVGEMGYPLNINQKMKVDLARALYQNADIYLLDDPFRCTDASVAEQLYQRVVGPNGVLQKKIRIIATSDIEFLPDVDHIIFLKDGNVVEQGCYSELATSNGYFAEYLNTKSDKSFAVEENEKNFSKPKCDFSFGNFKYQCDPWHTATELSLKAETESFMPGEIMTAPKALFRKVFNYFRMNGALFIVASILTATIANFCEVASLTWWTWRTAQYGRKYKIYMDLYIYAGLISCQVLFSTICGTIISCGNTLALGRMYNWMINRIMRASLATFGSTFVRRVLRSFDKDLRFSDEEISIEIFMWLMTVTKAPIILVVIFVSCPILIPIFLPLIIVFFIVQKFYLNAWRQLHHLTASARCRLFNFMENIFQGISNIRASKTSISFMSRFHSKLDTHNKCNFLFLLVSRWLSSSVEIIGSFFVLFTALIAIIERGTDSYFTGLVIILVIQVPECLINLTYLSSMLDIDLSCLERFQSFSNIKQEDEWDNQLSGPWPTSGSIKVKDLNVVYGEGLYPALNNINITIRPGEKVAIVGNENSGISTLLDSLFRIREISEGEIFIDNIDISNIGLHDLRSNLSIIPQDPLIFNGTVRENLDPEQNHRDEDLQMTVETVELGSNYTDLGKSINNNISIQEKYRIALARGILKMSKIVIIDGYENSIPGEKYFQNCTLVSFGNSQGLDNYDRLISISSGDIVKEITDPV